MSAIVVKINNEDVTSAVKDLPRIPIYGRNYDFSQVFQAITFTLTYKYRAHGSIVEGETICEIFINDHCVFTGYIESAAVSGYYQKKIKVQHIAQNFNDIKPLQDAKDETGVYQLRSEFVYPVNNFTVAEFLQSMFSIIGYTAIIPDNYIDEAGTAGDIFSVNYIFDSIRLWGQEILYDEDTGKTSSLIDPDKAPTMWELLKLLQQTFHFSCRFESFYGTKNVNIITPGHYWAADFDIPSEVAGINVSWDSLKDNVRIINNNLLSDEPEKKSVKKESEYIETKYSESIFYPVWPGPGEPKEIEKTKQYEAIKYKDRKINYPENFTFAYIAPGPVYGVDRLPFPLKTTLNPIFEKFIVTPAPVSAYARWMQWQDYAIIGIYQAGFQKAAEYIQDSKYYLQEWDNQVLTKFPRKIDFITKEKILEIKQDEPVRN